MAVVFSYTIYDKPKLQKKASKRRHTGIKLDTVKTKKVHYRDSSL